MQELDSKCSSGREKKMMMWTRGWGTNTTPKSEIQQGEHGEVSISE